MLPGCPVGTAEDGSLNYEKEISMSLKDMKTIGYESEWIEATKNGRLEKLLRETGEGIDSDAIAQEQSEDEDTMLSAIRKDNRAAERGPAGSSFLVEDALLSDSDVFDAIPETSSPRKRNQVDTVVPSKKPVSRSTRGPSTSPKKDRQVPVPVLSVDEDSDDEDTTRQNVVSKRSNHAASPKKGARPSSSRGSDGAPASVSHPVLRSPWEPSPTKQPPKLESKAKSTKPQPPPKPVLPPDDDTDESDDDLENIRNTTLTLLTQSAKASSSPSKDQKASKGRASSPAQPTSTSKASTKEKEKDVSTTKKSSTGKSPKRNIQTQESDEEFQIESQGDLSARRKKILSAKTDHRGLVTKKSVDVMDVDSDLDIQLVQAMQISTKVGPPRGKAKAKQSKGEQTKDNDGSGDEYQVEKKERLSSNAKAAMKKLRDSISGKDDLKAPKADTPKGKEERPKASNIAGQPRSRAKTKQKDTDDEQDQYYDDANNYDDQDDSHIDQDDSLPTMRQRSASTDPSSDKPAPPTEDGSRRPSKATKARAPTSKHASTAPRKSTEHGDSPEPPVRARRGAAERASDLLHNKIMPDVNLFAEQIRKGDVRGDWEDTNVRRRQWEQKRTKRPRADTDGTADEHEDGRRKRRKSDDEGPELLDKRKSVLPSTTQENGMLTIVRNERVESVPNTGIRILTTKLPLTDEEISVCPPQFTP